MFTKVDKAWVALLVSFLSATILQFVGWDISPELQAGFTEAVWSLLQGLGPVAVATGFFTWLIPNKD